MIVKKQKETIEKAAEIGTKVVGLISKEISIYGCEDDPAESIYLSVHILGNLLAKVYLSLENYGEIYGIPNLTIKSLKEWINTIADEHIKINTNLRESELKLKD